MNYVLITFNDNWADEIDIQGMLVTTKDQLDTYLLNIKEFFIKNPEGILTYCIGTNENIEHKNYESIESCISVKKITEQEYKTFKKTIGTCFGEIGLWSILDYN